MTVRLHPDFAMTPNASRTYEVVPGRTVIAEDLELGDSVEKAEVEIRGADSGCPTPDLLVQYETSVIISDEGPHLVLLEWRHHTSDWLRLGRDAEGRLRLPEYSDAERSRFPEVTTSELLKAIEAAGGAEWRRVAGDITGPHDPPASVGLTSIRLRVSCGPEAGAQTSFTIEFPVAIGC